MKRMLTCLLALAMLLVLPARAEGDYYGDMTVVNCEAFVTLRAAPSPGGQKLAEVPLGATVTDCTRYDDFFIYGCYEGAYGYIRAAYLAANGGYAEPENAGGYAGDMVVVNCEEWVSMRAEPSTGAARVARVPLGATVTDCAWYTADFVYGCYDGQYGYILGAYLAAADNAGTATHRTRVEQMEGEDFELRETLYHSALGYTIWYPEDFFALNDYSSESGESFMLEGYDGEEYLPVTVEFLTPESSGYGGMDFIELAGMDGDRYTGALNMGETEDGVTFAWRAGSRGMRCELYYLVMDEAHEAQVFASIDMELLETYGGLVDGLVASISFDD